jgi:predicted nuclease with TOPRIM domain
MTGRPAHMQSSTLRHKSIWTFLFSVALAAQLGFAGVSRAIQDRYRRDYDNKAFFLKIPLYSERQMILITGGNVHAEQGAGAARIKVGEQVRITGIDFGGDEIKIKLVPITTQGLFEVIFKFDANLQDNFPNSAAFDNALQLTFTEGLKYTDIEDAKKTYVEDQFEKIVQDIATTTGTSREAVMKGIAPRLPAYQDAMRDIDNLRGRGQELAAQISQLQSENRKLESELKSQQGEVSRLKTANASLQEKIDNSASQLSRLGEDLRSARGMTQGYQKELANLQRTLNLKIDSNRDLGSQIAELSQAMKKLQAANDTLESQVTSLRGNVEQLHTANAKLTGDLEDSKNSNRKMRETIDTLTSKEDSLARQYIQLKAVKENLETVARSIDSLSNRVVEEKSEGGFRSGKIGIFVKNILLGTVDYRIPEYLSANEERQGEAHFSSESIDYVQVTADERALLRSFGDKLKLELKLVSPVGTIAVAPQSKEQVQEIGEREQASWSWLITNRGTQDARLQLDLRMVNRNSDEIPVMTREYLLSSSSVVRQMRTYLQPIPVGIGAVLGFVLFGIAGVFRRSRAPRPPRSKGGIPEGTQPTPYAGKKQL